MNPSRRLLLVRIVSALIGAAALVRAGAPVLDDVLYHESGQPQARFAIHFDKPGGCGQHAEQCAIAAQRPSLAAAPSHRDAGQRVFAIAEVAIPPYTPPALRTAARLLPASRAPPVTSL